MIDQAENLRRMMTKNRLPKVVSITSGKGGVGKTMLAINLAICCRNFNKRVILFDVDLGLANVDVVLNLRPHYNLSDVLRGKKNIQDILIEAPGGISIVPGASGMAELANLDDVHRDKLVDDLRVLEHQADIIFIDTSAGISKNTINFALASDEVIVISTPEPTSITDAYATIKTISKRKTLNKIKLIINQTQSKREARRTAERIISVSRQFLNIDVQPMGYILRDENVSLAVRKRRPLVLEYPNANATTCIKNISRIYNNSATYYSHGRPHSFFSRLFHLLRKGKTGQIY